MTGLAPSRVEIQARLEQALAERVPVVIATVVRGGQVGATMAVSSAGDLAGSVSGGCVESAVFEEAQEVLRTGQPKLIRYGITDEMAWDVGLACGGTIEVFVEPVTE